MTSIFLAAALATATAGPATYNVKLVRLTPPKLAVTADIPIDGRALAMDTTRPGDIPELDDRGWPALITNLKVSDAAGGLLPATSAGTRGWELPHSYSGRLTVEYEVDYTALGARGWPAPREAAFAGPSDLALVGRSIFITTPAVGSSIVTFDLPRGWRSVTPWQPKSRSAKELAVGSAPELVENFVVFTRAAPDVVTAGGFRLLVTPMGHWEPARKEVRRILGAVIPRLVELMRVSERESYLVLLLPVVDRGGESYRHSFALTLDTPPSRANSATWGNTIAHEVFHEWNGWRIHGADYASSQWFQEGFTEYAANVSMVAAGVVSPDDFRQTLAQHVRKYRDLKTTLEGSGSHKGPPLYSAGALVAFSWDVQIRHATEGRRNLWDFMRALWHRTDSGRRPFEWPDIQAALEATAPSDWESFHRSYIAGGERLPLESTFALAGLRLDATSDGAPRVAVDPAAPAASHALLRALVAGNPDTR